MGWFVTSIVLMLIGLVAMFIGRGQINRNNRNNRRNKTTAKAVTVASLVAGFVILGLNSFTIVPPKNVGIPIVFGKANTTLDNGMHFIQPWANVEQVDGTVQTQTMQVTVRLANQTTAVVDVVVQWNVDSKSHANELWQRYRGKDDNVIKNIHDNVVWRQTTVSLNKVFADYNPLVVLTGGVENRDQATLAQEALALLKSSVDPGIVVDTLAISLIHYDPVTQEKLNGYAQALADTQIATQQKLTAKQQQLANEKLAVGSSNDPGVKYQNCLNMLSGLAAKGQLQNLQYGGLMCSMGNNSLIVGK